MTTAVFSNGVEAIVEASTEMIDSAHPGKKFRVDRLNWNLGDPGLKHEHERIEYRFGYYIAQEDGTWVWARNSPIITGADLFKLMGLALSEGTIKP